MAKRGRPRLKAKDRKSEPVGVRLTKELLNQLEDARRQGDVERSMTQEIVLRLRESFEKEQEIKRRFGGPATAMIFEILADQIRQIEIGTGGIDEPGGIPRLRWFSDRFTYDQVRSMIDVVLDHFKPDGERTIPEAMRWHPILEPNVETFGRYGALLALSSIQAAMSKSKEKDVRAIYDRAAFHLGRLLKGSPVDDLQREDDQQRQRILNNPLRPDAKLEAAALEKQLQSIASDFGELSATDEIMLRQAALVAVSTVDPVIGAAIRAVVLYLQPKVKPGLPIGERVTLTGIAETFAGITDATTLAQLRPTVIDRIKALTTGKLIEPILDLDLDRLFDAAIEQGTNPTQKEQRQ